MQTQMDRSRPVELHRRNYERVSLLDRASVVIVGFAFIYFGAQAVRVDAWIAVLVLAASAIALVFTSIRRSRLTAMRRGGWSNLP